MPRPDAFAPRLVALRLDSGGEPIASNYVPVMPDATVVVCSEIAVEPASMVRLPLITLKFDTVFVERDRTLQISWLEAIDTQTMNVMYRVPVMMTTVTSAREAGGDQLTTERRDEARADVTGRFSGLTATVAVEPAPLGVRFMRPPLSQPFHLFGSPALLSVEAIRAGPWGRVTMQPVGWRGQLPALPPGLTSVGGMMAGAYFREIAPKDPVARVRFWRAQLKHPHLMVRVAAATELARTNDLTADALPDLMRVLTALAPRS